MWVSAYFRPCSAEGFFYIYILRLFVDPQSSDRHGNIFHETVLGELDL